MKARRLPSIEYLRECFELDVETGALTWRERPGRHFKTAGAHRSWNTRHAGKAAYRIRAAGHIGVSVCGVEFTAHRIVWALAYGADPEGREIDHINGVKTDNRLSNLRLASHAENMRNTRPHQDNRSGLKGVAKNGPGFSARVQSDGRTVCLGTFRTKEEAHRAYCEAASKLHGEFFRAS